MAGLAGGTRPPGSARCFIGVDGGGTQCRVCIADAAGRVMASATGGSANVYLDFDAALATVAETVARARAAAGSAVEAAPAALGLGLAGVSSHAVEERVAARLAPHFARVTVRNDAVIACLGAHAGADGGLVIAGTGSAAVLRRNGVDLNLGGRGFLLGDDGSGAVIGRQAWRRALRAHDGLEPATPLLDALMAEFDHDPVAVIQWGRAASSGQYASYAPRVVAAAAAQDAAALPIVAEAAAAIAELVGALARRGAARIALVGGLAAPLAPHLAAATRDLLSPPLLSALDGALLLAGAPLPPSGRGALAPRPRIDSPTAAP